LTETSPTALPPERSSALEHPLPAGMRDLLPEESRTLSALGRELLRAFELHGYERVTLPVFEYAEVLERGLGELDPRAVLRFVEPESGEVVALRPDMTPQIARLVATRLRSVPGPARLCYEGSVVRLRRERARRRRQIPQAGVELLGSAAPDGDFEVLEVATTALRATGLDDFVLDLGHARVAGALVELAPASARTGLVEALSLKDPAVLERRARAAGLAGDVVRALVELSDLHGGDEVWSRAEKSLAGTPAEAALGELRSVWRWASERRLAPRVSVDLGEVRDLGYYTGVTFQLLAEGPGAPVAAGGRYDGLLAKFGAPRPAAGFAVALDDLIWALGARPAAAAPRVLVAGAAERAEPVIAALRSAGIAAARALERPREHARAWRYTHVAEVEHPSVRLHEVATGKDVELAGGSDTGSKLAELVMAGGSKAGKSVRS
jgi:ATP phosphoribosyltransferase regulatory subunit